MTRDCYIVIIPGHDTGHDTGNSCHKSIPGHDIDHDTVTVCPQTSLSTNSFLF